MDKKIFNLKIFSGIDKEVVEKIIMFCEKEKFNEDDIIMAEGDESNGKGYIIEKGRVSISMKGSKIVELSVGDIIGEIALLNEEARTATVKALEEVETIVLTLDHLIDMINNDDNSINKEIIRRIESNIED